MSDSGWKNFLKGTSFDRRSQEIDTIKPLWTIDLDNEEALIEWHKKISEDLEDSQNERVANYVRNRNLYCGLHYHLGNTVKIARDVNSEWVQSNKSPEIVVNHCYELTEQWVSKLSSFSAEVEIIPVNTEEGDRTKARAAQRFADDLSEKNDLKGLMLRLIRDSKIGGESYIVVDYDENKGDLHPDAKKAQKEGLRIPLKDSKGQIIMGEDGSTLLVDTQKRVGDLVYRLRSIPEILLQPKQRWVDVEWFREVELVDVDDLKRRYPDKAIDISLSFGGSKRSGDTYSLSGNDIFVYTYWHKGTVALDKGRKIVMLDDLVLENGDNPFSGAPLPIVRLTDIDIEGELYGWSFLNNIATMQFALNKLYTLYYTNIALGSHIYWLVPASARVAKDRIRNSASVIQYNGVQKPEIATFRTVGSEIPACIEKLEQRILTISRIQATSRGELPPNVEAGVAIGILEEQEEQSAIPDVKKVNAAIEKLFSISLGIAGDKYDKSDGRTARILGQEGEYLLETLDTAKLSGPYDVKVRKTTALSKSKALMIQEMTQLEAMRPGIFSNEEFYDALQLGDREKFYDIATAAKRTAEMENERMREGFEVAEPMEGEFHLVHWKSHMLVFQTPTFKTLARGEVVEEFKEHIGITEMFLTEQAKRNIALAMELSKEPYFPSFYVPDFTIPQIITALQQGNSIPALGEKDAPMEMNPMAMAGQAGMESEVPVPESASPEAMPDVPAPEDAMSGESALVI
jgi:hypothetical protein